MTAKLRSKGFPDVSLGKMSANGVGKEAKFRQVNKGSCWDLEMFGVRVTLLVEV